MTRLRERAREIKEAGEAERGNWDPNPNGWPIKLYRYWLEESGNEPPERENFCHYGRVVLFWAPLYWLSDKLINPVMGWVAGLTVLAVLSTLSYKFMDFRIVMGMIVALLAVALSISYVVNKFWRKSWEKPLMWLLGGTAIACLVTSVGMLLYTIWMAAGWWMLVGFGILAVFIGAGVFCADWIAGRRRLKKEAHHEWVASLAPDEYDEYVAQAQEPGWLKNVLVAFGDFFILLGQMLRTKKWKICPFVELPE